MEAPHELDTNEPCEGCGAVWEPAPEVGLGALQMTHTTFCPWWTALTEATRH